MSLSKDRLQEIFYEIVGDPEEYPWDYENYRENVFEDSTEDEAKMFARIIKEELQNTPYE
jgi:hypothetical protein